MIIFEGQELRLIEGTEADYVSNKGNVYRLRNGEYIPNTLYKNSNGYVYVYVHNKNVQQSQRTKRVHKLVALAFLDNPNNLPVVGHKNNIKSDNRVENLYWTTYSENTQKAYKDALMANDKGIYDSQSYPIACYDKDGNLVSVYGSISEAGRCIKNYPLHSIEKVVGHGLGVKGYRFEYISKEDYFNVPQDRRGIKFQTFRIEKVKSKILVTFLKTGEKRVFETQKQIERELGFSQSMVSRLVKTGKIKWDCKFERVL